MKGCTLYDMCRKGDILQNCRDRILRMGSISADLQQQVASDQQKGASLRLHPLPHKPWDAETVSRLDLAFQRLKAFCS